MIRKAKPDDADGIFQFAAAGAERYPQVRPEPGKMRALIREAISSAQHFCWVSDVNGEVAGVIIGMSAENTWAQRKCCPIQLWISLVPGDGAALLREFRNWIVSRRVIKVAGFAPDIDVDPRVWKLAERIGFKKHGGSFLLYN